MPARTTKLAHAVRMALPLGLIFAPIVHAQTTDSSDTAADSSKAKTLDAVSVTGSLVRRVDTETASPIIAVDRQQIQESGKQTLGDLLQSLPGIAGAATNPAVNNGGGDGASTISLRGLGSARTLVLIDGHRIVNNDVNAIPTNMIERVEVMKVGASAMYGSDAIGGVVNFILRKNYEGGEVSSNYGQTSYGDGARHGGAFTWGKTWDRGNLVIGLDYNKQNSVSSADRAYSKNALYLTSGVVTKSGSSRTPSGYYKVPSSTLSSYGCSSSGALTSTSSGYKCYSSSDAYNYQAQNLLMTPQERVNSFVMGTFNITDNTQAYIEAYHNHTMSHSSIAALPFDAQSDDITIAADNAYNTLGVEFGPDGYEYRTRFTSLGNREYFYDTTTDQVVAGLKGVFGDSSWVWNVDLDYGHYLQRHWSHGYVDYTALQEAIDAGEVNIFDQSDSNTVAWMKSHQSIPRYTTTYISKQWEASASGDLWDLPAGAVQLAAGALYRKETENYTVSSNATMESDGTSCGVASEACSSPMSGGFDVKEAYAQLFIPLLEQSSPIGAMNATLSDRFSKYSSVSGSGNNSASFQLEWRPIQDVMLRGTAAQVFRAPTISDLYSGASSSSPQFDDPCIGYSGSGHSNACSGVSEGWTGSGLSQTNAIVSGSKYADYDLKPEKGKSYDIGLVYSPSWVQGLSINLDWWQVKLDDLIQTISAQTVADLCYADDSSNYCSFIHRYASGTASAGQIQYIETPTVNIGTLNTQGIDFGFNYALPETAYGKFNLALDTTYIQRYDIDTGSEVYHLAGKYDSSFGNYTRWRGRAQLGWHLGNWDAQFTERWVGKVHIDSDTDPLNFGDFFYHSVQVGYTIPDLNVRFDLGVDNLGNKQPPIMYMNNVINANTDVSTYDTIGRYYWMRATYKF